LIRGRRILRRVSWKYKPQLCVPATGLYRGRTSRPCLEYEAPNNRAGTQERPMKHIVASQKSVAQAAADLEQAVKRHGFGVLHVYDLKQTLEQKGAPIENECRIFEVCNPHKARSVLNEDMSLNMALPCRISVFEQDGATKIGMLSPKAMLAMLSDSAELAALADEVEEAIEQMIDDAK